MNNKTARICKISMPSAVALIVFYTGHTSLDIVSFLRALVAQKKHLASKLSAGQGWEALPLDSIAILNYLSTHDRITVSEAETLTQTSRSTLKLRLKQLLEEG